MHSYVSSCRSCSKDDFIHKYVFVLVAMKALAMFTWLILADWVTFNFVALDYTIEHLLSGHHLSAEPIIRISLFFCIIARMTVLLECIIT